MADLTGPLSQERHEQSDIDDYWGKFATTYEGTSTGTATPKAHIAELKFASFVITDVVIAPW